MFTPYLFSILGFYYIFLGCVGQGVKDKDLTPVLGFSGIAEKIVRKTGRIWPGCLLARRGQMGCPYFKLL